MTLRTAGPSDVPADPPAHRRTTSRRSPAAAQLEDVRHATRRGSWSATSTDVGRRVRRAGAAQRRRRRGAIAGGDEAFRGRQSDRELVERLRQPRRRPRLLDALRVHARARALRPHGLLDRAAHLGAGEDRARLHVAARCSGAAASTPSRWRCAPASRVGPARPAAVIHGTRPTAAAPGAATGRRRAEPIRRGGPGVTTSRSTIDGGVTAPRGFRAAGVACGIKAQRRARSRAARRRTSRRARPACSRRTWRRPRRSSSRATTWRGPAAAAAPSSINSGCANACTGDDGRDHARGDGRADRPRRSAAIRRACSSRRPA